MTRCGRHGGCVESLGRSLRLLRWMAVCGAIVSVWSVPPRIACGQNPFAADEEPADDADATGMLLPTDRGRERRLEQARRLMDDGQWSDAAAALDELLAGGDDVFVDDGAATRSSVRGAAARLVATLPRPGREAYLLLCRGRADEALAAAIAAGDPAAIVAVARRWLHTPAGRRAALLAAVGALEAGEPAAAAVWLERLAADGAGEEFEPTLSLMRAVAARQVGDDAAARAALAAAASRGGVVQLAGREVSLSDGARSDDALAALAGAGRSPSVAADWLQPRGAAGRNALAQASRPLLVARYRVPLVRHPEEARLLDQRRRAAADAGRPLAPAGLPLAVGDRLVVQTPLGILAVDFESGKRLWLGSAVPPASRAESVDDEADAAALDRTFQDVTSGTLSSDGRHVFAVEIPPAALVPPAAEGGFPFNPGWSGTWDGSNTLTAYDLSAGGAVRWRLPAAGDRVAGDSGTWFMAAPLVIGDELFVLVEERGEVRLDVLAAADGSVRWSQPLGAYDDREAITSPAGYRRRLAGLAPAAGEGVLVCPLGSGCVVALDLATRSLLWAHSYPRPADAGGGAAAPPGGDPWPVIAGGRVLLTPPDGEGLICLGLRDGRPAWPTRPGRLRLAGVVGDGVIVVGDAAVESLALETGQRRWVRPHVGEGRPSGRGIVTAKSLLVPLDTAEVVEIALADGGVVARCPARGGTVIGNLVPHRGEIVARSLDSLDVFHQEQALDDRIETALRTDPGDAWGRYWRGQSLVERGDVAEGLRLVTGATGPGGLRIPPRALAESIERALERDFTAATARWPEALAADPRAATPELLRIAAAGFLERGDAAAAWGAIERLLVNADEPGPDDRLVAAPGDRQLSVSTDRWIRGAVRRVAAAADEPLRARIDAAIADCVREATAAEGPAAIRRLETLDERIGWHPAATGLRGPLAAAAERRQGTRALRAALEATPATGAEAESWPLGRVAIKRPRVANTSRIDAIRAPMLPIPLSGRGVAEQASLDANQRRLVVSDRFGRPVCEPLPLEGLDDGLPMAWIHRAAVLDVAVCGRLLFTRTAGELVAFDLEPPRGESHGLWRRPEYRSTADLPGRAMLDAGTGARRPREGLPLGLRITEPEDGLRGGARGIIATPAGLLVPGTRSLAMLDPVTGRVLWERRGLPAGLEWSGDDRSVCGCTSDGHDSLVLAMEDGRLLETIEVPPAARRVAVHEGRIVAVRSIDEQPGRFTARRVRLELFDPFARRTVTLLECDGEARATLAGPGSLAVIEPSGTLTLFALADGSEQFKQVLPEMPRRVDQVAVQRWEDRYLVFAGGAVEADDIDVVPPPQLMFATGAAGPVSGAVWSIDALDGRLVWPVPALVERHCLHVTQPSGLPLLTFCRVVNPSGDSRLGLLCLDKRTGHAVIDDDRITVPGNAFFGCDLEGDPATGLITIRDASAAATRVVLAFTGEPLAPRPPYRGPIRPRVSDDEPLPPEADR